MVAFALACGPRGGASTTAPAPVAGANAGTVQPEPARVDPREQLAALERGLAANPDPSTRGMLLLNKAARLQGSGDRDGAVAILRALAADPASTEQSEALAKDSLRRLGAPSELERA